MHKNKCTIIDLYQTVTLVGVALVTWKVAHHWHTGLAEKTGQTIDKSISAAAKKLEKTAIALEEWADTGSGEHLGKNIDTLLTETKKTLETTVAVVNELLNHAKPR